MPYFVRPAESRVLVALRDHGESPLEALVAHAGLSPADVREALPGLQRRGLVVEVDEGRYALTSDGVRAGEIARSGGAGEGSAGLFLLDDDVEEAASVSSEEDLNRALDEALGRRDDAPDH
ncbi:hypothetical protein AB0M95_35955 [Sphaerisporangium sp. NPDC051017]|uniref:hypothetical protein n=1 Tax=Sphaerisporangium sp. NPDC051017 TaxID=3154636 RepID=UPI00341FC4FE